VSEHDFLYSGGQGEATGKRLPKRTSLVDETAATLKEWISRSVLKQILPGELQLKNRLRVGRDTLRLALKALTDEGWILPAVKGQQRRVATQRLPRGGGSSADRLPVTFLSPHAVEHRITLLETEDTQQRLAEQGRRLQFISPEIFHLKRPQRHLERLVQEHPSSAWILYVTSEPIQRWFAEQGLPTFLYEAPFPGVDLPYVVADWEAAAFHAGIQLVRHGHRRIGMLEYQERRPGLLLAERGLKRALATVGAEDRMMLFKDDRSPISVARSLEMAFSLKAKPTAIIATRAAQLLTCYSWLASQGIRVPAEISLISLANDSWYAEFDPPICHYQPNSRIISRQMAQRVLDLVATGRVGRKSVRVPMDYVAGATIGPVTGGRVSTAAGVNAVSFATTAPTLSPDPHRG
jgi:DNA-binding LacI/PurR family transcriptional regulator